MGRVASQGHANGRKAAAKRTELGRARDGARAAVARFARQAGQVEATEKKLAEEKAARVALAARVTVLERRLFELEESLRVVVT